LTNLLSRLLGRCAAITIAFSAAVAVAAPAVARAEPTEPFEEIELFEAAGAVGTLVLPAGAPDRRTPAIVILQDALDPDGRAGLYVDQLLGADLAVLELSVTEGMNLGAIVDALAAHPRILGTHVGLLGFGAGARLVAEWPGRVRARALLYPGCASLLPAAMPDEAVLLKHGDADALNTRVDCEHLATGLGSAARALRWRVLAGVSYAWDHPTFGAEGRSMPPAPDGSGPISAAHWPAVAALSAAELAGFFATSLLGPAR